MTVFNLHAAKTHLSRLVEKAAAGEEVVIAKAGIPAVRLVAVRAARGRSGFGALRGKIRIAQNFDAPLPAPMRRAFGAK